MENKENKEIKVNSDNKVIYYVLGAIALIAIAMLVVVNMKTSDNAVVVPEINDTSALNPNLSPSDVNKAIEDTSTGSVNAGASVTISYANALLKYKDARIQLTNVCQAFPQKAVYKNGTTIMIDNRAPVSRTIKVGSVYTVKAYGFKLIKLSSAKLPATWLIDCDKSQNVATLMIEK